VGKVLLLNIYNGENSFISTTFSLAKGTSTSQFRRAAISIAANIAEGYKKKDYKNKIHFFNIAQGSLEECKYHIILSKDLNYPSDSELEILSEEISKLLAGYIKSINANNSIS
jgi:four helix bundle protein